MIENPIQTEALTHQVKVYDLKLPEWHKPTLRDLPEYKQWATMLSRCRNPNVPKYSDYGGRGIKVCARWERGETGQRGFECFLEDMGRRPSQKHSIDRKNNDGNYEPGNCKWSTNKEQCNNRRSNRKLTYNGETMSMMDMAARHNMSYFVLRNRVSRGWPIEDAIRRPFGESWRPPKTAVGQALPQTILTGDDVVEIRHIYAQGGVTMLQLGLLYGVTTGTVFHLIHRNTWKHIP